MRGSKGGFWDRLRARIRYRKIMKQKKEKIIEDEKTNSQNTKKLKTKKEEIQVRYVFNKENNYELKSKQRSFKIHKKGISTNVITYSKDDKKVAEQVLIIPKKNVPKKKKKTGTSSKVETKNVSIITKKRIIKRKKGINPTKEKNNHLNEKSTKLIDELNKLIEDNREKINEITFEIADLKKKLENSKTIKEVEEIEQKLIELKRRLIELMETYTNIKDASFSKTKIEKIENIIVDIKKIDPNFKFDEIANKVTPNLDYYNDMSNCAIDTVNMIYSSSYQKDIIRYKNNEEQNMNVKLDDFSEINNRLSKELNKHRDIINEFNMLISKISPKKIVDVQNDFLATMLHNTGCLIGAFLSIPFLKRPKNVPLFAFGLFTINNSIRNMRKVTTTENISYVPSDDYANQIIRYKNSFEFVDYMISDSLYQISELKEEYKINFSGFHNTEEFIKNLQRIETIESKIQKQAKEIKELKNKYEKTLDKNYEKVLSINKK